MKSISKSSKSKKVKSSQKSKQVKDWENYLRSNPAKIMTKHGEYFPNKAIWLVFDMSNGHKGSRRYTWWFDSKIEANEWIKEHLKNPHACDVSKPTKWRMSNTELVLTT
jgi:hypothetical protein